MLFNVKNNILYGPSAGPSFLTDLPKVTFSSLVMLQLISHLIPSPQPWLLILHNCTEYRRLHLQKGAASGLPQILEGARKVPEEP